MSLHSSRLAALSVSLLVTVFGASARAAVETRVDEDFDFTELRSFGWRETPSQATRLAADDPVGAEARKAVEEELQAKGYRRSDQPDFLIAIDGALTQIEGAGSDSFRISSRVVWEPIEDAPRNRSVTQGTLILQMFPADEPERRIWGGADTVKLADAQVRDQTLIQRARRLVRRILREFPPQ